MFDDFKSAKTALAKFHQDMEVIGQAVYLSVIKQMELSRALEM